MKTRVFHKGLLIVALPVLIELVIVGCLAGLIAITDGEQERIDLQRVIRHNASRVMFADFGVGVQLGKVWARRDMQGLLDAVYAIDRAEQQTALNRGARRANYPDKEVAEELQRQAEIQTRILHEFRTITQAIVHGANSQVLTYQRELMQNLDADFARMMVLEDRVERNIDARRERLQILTNMEIAVVVAWVLATVVAALWLGAYFRSHIIKRLDQIRANIERIAAGKEPQGTLTGSDEIFELDRAFHDMHAQLRIAAGRERALFDNSTEVLSVIDENLQVLRINKAAESLWELPWGAIPSHSLEDLLAPSDFKLIQPLFLNASRHPEQSIGFETERSIDGGILIQSQWSCVWSDTQKLYYIVIHDVTDERQQARLKRSFLELIAAAFRDPLKRISETFEALADNQADWDQTARTKVDGAVRTLDRLVALVDELIQLEEVESRDLKLEHHECKVAEILEEALNDVQALAIVRDTEIVLDCQAETCSVDSRRIIQVLGNLLSNAIKFSPDGSKIRLAACTMSDGIRVSVQDQGRGIPESFKDQVFDPFKQSRASDGTRGKGSGLGLVIARKIVEQHGGEIGFESQENQGTIFWFTIPTSQKTPILTAPLDDSQISLASDTSIPEHDLKTPLPKDSPERKWRRFGADGQLSLRRKMQILVGVPVLFQLVFVILMSGLLFKAGVEQELQFRQMDSTSSAVKLAIGLYSFAFQALGGATGSMPPDKGDEAFSKFQTLSKSILASWQADSLTKQYCSTIGDLTQQIARTYSQVKGTEANNKEQLHRNTFELLSLTQKANRQVEQIVAASVLRESPSPQVQKDIRRSQMLLLLLGLTASVATALSLAYLFSRDVTTRLSVLLNNSKRLVKGLPPIEASQGTDELAQLDADFHSMAAKLVAARTQERAFLDNSMDLIFALDKDLRFCAISRAIVPLTGFAADHFMNSSVLDIIPDAEKTKVHAVFDQVKADGKPQRFETPILQSVQRLDASLSVAWSADEELFLCVARDISKLKELERIKEEFLGFVTHDLRSPLSTILTLSSLLEAGSFGSLPQESLRLTSQIRRNCNDLIELVNDLLDLQKLSSGAMNLTLVRIDSDVVLDMAVSMLTQEADQNRIVIDLPFDSPKIKADPERLARAFAGLLAELIDLGPGAIIITMPPTAGPVTFHLRFGGSSEPAAHNNLLHRLTSKDDVLTGPSGLSRLRILLSIRLIDSHGAVIEAFSSPEGALSLIVSMPIAD